jgi:hypothetical protein
MLPAKNLTTAQAARAARAAKRESLQNVLNRLEKSIGEESSVTTEERSRVVEAITSTSDYTRRTDATRQANENPIRDGKTALRTKTFSGDQASDSILWLEIFDAEMGWRELENHGLASAPKQLPEIYVHTFMDYMDGPAHLWAIQNRFLQNLLGSSRPVRQSELRRASLIETVPAGITVSQVDQLKEQFLNAFPSKSRSFLQPSETQSSSSDSNGCQNNATPSHIPDTFTVSPSLEHPKTSPSSMALVQGCLGGVQPSGANSKIKQSTPVVPTSTTSPERELTQGIGTGDNVVTYKQVNIHFHNDSANAVAPSLLPPQGWNATLNIGSYRSSLSWVKAFFIFLAISFLLYRIPVLTGLLHAVGWFVNKLGCLTISGGWRVNVCFWGPDMLSTARSSLASIQQASISLVSITQASISSWWLWELVTTRLGRNATNKAQVDLLPRVHQMGSMLGGQLFDDVLLKQDVDMVTIPISISEIESAIRVVRQLIEVSGGDPENKVTTQLQELYLGAGILKKAFRNFTNTRISGLQNINQMVRDVSRLLIPLNEEYKQRHDEKGFFAKVWRPVKDALFGTVNIKMRTIDIALFEAEVFKQEAIPIRKVAMDIIPIIEQLQKDLRAVETGVNAFTVQFSSKTRGRWDKILSFFLGEKPNRIVTTLRQTEDILAYMQRYLVRNIEITTEIGNELFKLESEVDTAFQLGSTRRYGYSKNRDRDGDFTAITPKWLDFYTKARAQQATEWTAKLAENKRERLKPWSD